MLAPVVIFVYNRPEHTKQTIESLARNNLAKKTDVYIFADAAKNENAAKLVRQVEDYIETIEEKNYFNSVNIQKSQYNKGLANSVISGVSEIIDVFGKVIVIEDDLISSSDFLQYMNDGLDYYENNKKIWSISGYNIPIKIPKNYSKEVYLSYRGCSWGWATWKDRWESIDWEVTDYKEFKRNKKLRRMLNRGGRDMSGMLDSQINGKIDSWAIRWCYEQSKQNKFTIYPVQSRIKNIGLDGSGTHSSTKSNYDVILDNNIKRCEFENLELNRKILKRFQNHYMGPIHYILANTKKILKTVIRM